MLTKSALAIRLSRLAAFASPGISGEQYATSSEAAAELLWSAHMLGDIEGRAIADLGCGTGILGIGCLLLGAEKVYFVDIDSNALEAAEKNLQGVGASPSSFEILESEVGKVRLKSDVVIQNPPFGTKKRHADREFLVKAFSVADVIYSVHKETSTRFIKSLCSGNGFGVTHIFPLKLQIGQLHPFHKRRIYRVSAAGYRLQKL